MATTYTMGPGNIIRPHRNVRVRHFREAASQSFVRGDILVLNTGSDKGDEVKLSGADPTTDRAIVGVAGADASGTEGTLIPVYLFTPESEFVINSNGTLDVDDISVQYGIARDGTNKIWQLDLAETTAKIFTILSLLDSAGDVNGRYVVKPILSESLYGV